MIEELIEVERPTLAQRIENLGEVYAEQAELKNGLIAIANICEKYPNANYIAVITTLWENISNNRINNVNAVVGDKAEDKALYMQLISEENRDTIIPALTRLIHEDQGAEKEHFVDHLKQVLGVEVEH